MGNTNSNTTSNDDINQNKSLELTTVSIDQLKLKIVSALVSLNFDKKDAEIICDVILYAELRKNNQGIIKITSGELKPNLTTLFKQSNFVTIFESKLSAKIDGAQRCGMVVVDHGIKIALKKAKEHGMAIVGVNNYSSSTGALGYWTQKITKQGMIGIVMSQCNPLVAPYGSYEKVFGTNPISIGIPTLPRSQILDMSTAATPYFGLVQANELGQSIPDDVAYDIDGNPTSNPLDAIRGAIRVFDRSHKSSHLALMVELLAGAFTGASMGDKDLDKNWGSLIIVIDPSIMGNPAEFQANSMIMCNKVKNAKKLPNHDKIFLPGERGDEIEAEFLRRGEIDLNSVIYNKLLLMSSSDEYN
jgi:LDH2 family malate/lactate/ureidoglycolate dehydrogenase